MDRVPVPLVIGVVAALAVMTVLWFCKGPSLRALIAGSYLQRRRLAIAANIERGPPRTERVNQATFMLQRMTHDLPGLTLRDLFPDHVHRSSG